MKRLSVFILAIALVIGIVAPLGVTAAGPCGDLPSTVTMSYVKDWNTAYLATTISGGTILDGTYDGWCVDLEHQTVQGQSLTAMVVCSYDSAAASYVEYPDNLDLVNWILNRDFIGETGPYGTYTWQDVQVAIWRLVDDPANSGLDLTNWTEARVGEIIALAQTNGQGYVPGSGDLCVIILVPMDGEREITSQISIIARRLPGGGEGCTPGYWKNNWDKWDGVSWEATGYDGDADRFGDADIFDRTITVKVGKQTITNPTLFEALNAQGGGVNALARHAVAALLNAAHGDVDYAYNVAEVISMVQGALDGGDIQGVKDSLADANEAGCSINQHGEPIMAD